MMKNLFGTYQTRFVQNGLAASSDTLMGVAENAITWNQEAADSTFLEPLFGRLGLHAITRIRPAEPYRTIIDYLAAASAGTIYPRDMETRLFLTDLPVASSRNTNELAGILKHRNNVIIPGTGIVTTSSKSLKQAFVTVSSVCFASFVKFFSDLLAAQKSGAITEDDRQLLESIKDLTAPPSALTQPLAKGPFDSAEDIFPAICEAGKQVVDLRLVDSFFGNVSYNADNLLYISQTGTFLDALKDVIASCPVDPSADPPRNASSELPAHLEIIRRTGCRAILHGHPRFSVILSMDCDIPNCPYKGKCHQYCPYERHVCGHIPIVSGEVGGGDYGLCHTVPHAICGTPGVIVYGHGVFTCDETDFNGALAKLIDIERRCFLEYFNRMEMAA